MKNFDRIQKAIEFYIREFKNQPSISEVASHVGVSDPHFKKLFKEWAGVSPKKFLGVITAEYAKNKLLESRTVLDTTFESGLSSQGRLYDHMITFYGMTPGEIKNGGQGLTVVYGSSESPFGKVIIFFSEKGISQMDFLISDQGEYVSTFQKKWPNSNLIEDQKLASEKIKDIFNPSSKSKLKIHVAGTNFELNVWKALVNLPYGALTSYGQIAKHINKPTAHRAVANAIGRNPVAFIIPCHRVIRESGFIGGYKWGSTRKQAIQAKEVLA